MDLLTSNGTRKRENPFLMEAIKRIVWKKFFASYRSCYVRGPYFGKAV